ncbi:MAG: caspase family protein [Candidatus Aminicenantes bacterium]|nr:MAG: caspase family protein [Candidatus Aminicenantes bacterium]
MAPNKRALCVGINDYPGTGNNLYGCVNDANDWASLLVECFGFKQDNITLLTDALATRLNILSALTDLVIDAGPGDVIVFTYAGHGTYIPDQDGDEPDNRDEALFVHDGKLPDDELRIRLSQIEPRAHLTVISDSCHSGTITRKMLTSGIDINCEALQNVMRARFMPLQSNNCNMALPIRKRFLYPEYGMPEVLLTGCNAGESAYDAYINDRYNGIMTAAAVQLIRSNPKQTFRELHRNLRRKLPSKYYPQSPQLEGSDQNKNRQLFT